MDNINLLIERGITGLLGPNGAGKSTLMRTLATLQLPDKGKAVFRGADIYKRVLEYRQVLGYLPQDFEVYPRHSAYELLNYFGQLKGIHNKKERHNRIAEVLEITNLLENAGDRVDEFSGGMKQRFGIAQLLLNQPKMIIFDEPTAGLDPSERRKFLNVLRQIGEDAIILVSTHQVEDVSELCHQVAILSGGALLLHQTPSDAIKRFNKHVWNCEIRESEISEFQQKFQVISYDYSGPGRLNLRVLSEVNPGLPFHPVSPSLEDVYFIELKTLRV